MTSITVTLTGASSRLQADYFPEIDLSDGEYVCGLIDFQTFNSIPNVDKTNNLFYFGYENLVNDMDTNVIHKDSSQSTVVRSSILPSTGKVAVINRIRDKQPLSHIKIPTGSYEVEQVSKYLKKQLSQREVKLELDANKNTLKCEIICSQPVDFSKPGTIGSLLGFRKNTVLEADKMHVSPYPADILKVNVIRVDCNIVTGSYLNNKPSHTIHQFSPRVPPGYKIIEVPQNVIYFPVTVKSIHTLNLTILDQENNLIDFRGETITIRLHIKKIH